MKMYITVHLFVFTLTSLSQPVWNFQNTGTSAAFFRMHMFDSLNGIATGTNNSFYKTTNGGINWIGTSYAIKKDIVNSYFFNQSTGWKICYDYQTANVKLHKTTNAGNSWNEQFSNSVSWLQDIFFLTDNYGWLTSFYGEIIYTTNGGSNWTVISILNNQRAAAKIHFIDMSFGFAGCNLMDVYKTSDSGYNWSLVYSGGATGAIFDITFVNENIGFACGSNGRLIKTTDSGEHWSTQTTNCIFNLYSIKFLNENTGWAIGTYGTILYTTNSGSTWQRYNNVTNLVYHSLQIVNNKAWICGEFGLILKCENILDN